MNFPIEEYFRRGMATHIIVKDDCEVEMLTDGVDSSRAVGRVVESEVGWEGEEIVVRSDRFIEVDDEVTPLVAVEKVEEA